MAKINIAARFLSVFLTFALTLSTILPQNVFANAEASQEEEIISLATKLTLQVTHVTEGNGTYQGGNVKLEANLTDENGTPISGATIKFADNGSSASSRKTDAGGNAVFEYNFASSLSANTPYTFSAEYAGAKTTYNEAAAEYAGTKVSSQPVTIVNQAKPTGLYTVDTKTKNGKISGFDPSKEYEYAEVGHVINSTTWSPVVNSNITGLSPASYFIRLKSYTDGSTFYRASSNDFNIDIKRAELTVTPAVSDGVVWESNEPVDIVRLGQAKFKFTVLEDYEFESVSINNAGYAKFDFDEENSTVTVSNVTQNQKVTVKVKYLLAQPEPKPVLPDENAKIDTVKTTLDLAYTFRLSTQKESQDAGWAYFAGTLTDENGSPVSGATVQFTELKGYIAPGYRLTGNDGVTPSTYGAAFYPGSYDIKASFNGAKIGNVYYAPSQPVVKTIVIAAQKAPNILDPQVVASKDGAKKGKFLDLDNGLEYVEWIITFGIGQQWISVENNTVTGLNPNLYTFRYKQRVEGNTFYLASPEYIISLPRAEWTVTPQAGEHLIWEDLSPVDVAPDHYLLGYVSRVYFKVRAQEGYKIVGISTDKKDDNYYELAYNGETEILSVIGAHANLKIYVSVEKTEVEELYENNNKIVRIIGSYDIANNVLYNNNTLDKIDVDDGATSIGKYKNKGKSINKDYQILLEESVVSQEAKIKVITPETVRINLIVYDNTGNIVFEKSNAVSNGNEWISWNLTNNAGRIVANGSYLVIVEATGVTSGKVYRDSKKLGVKRKR